MRLDGVGASLLRSMGRRGMSRALSGGGGGRGNAPQAKMYVPSVIGGFSGSSTGVSYERYSLAEGCVVVRLPPSSQASSTPTLSSSTASCGLVFKPEEEIGDELLESSIDWKLMGTITRMSPSSNDVELLMADGVTREKVSVLELRAAGAMERESFLRWQVRLKSDGNLSSTGGTKRSREGDPPVVGEPLLDGEPWWVVKGIVVRVVNPSLSLLCGRKFVVAAASKKENRILLGDFTEADSSATSSGQQRRQNAPLTGGHAVQQQDLETVIPKDGGKALVLLGEHRGEIVTVQSKLRSAETREVVAVCCNTTQTDLLVTVQPDHLSQFLA